MTNKDFKEGMEVTFEHNKTKYNDGWKLYCDTDWKWYVCNGNMLSSNGWTRIGVENVTNLQPKHRTIDDLECGDIIIARDGDKRKCLGKCGEVYAVSETWGSVIPDNEVKTHSFWATIHELKNYGYTLYQPTEEKETDIDKCIKVVEEFFEGASTEGKYMKASLVKRLKNLKK